jgi:hypothetical protein
MPVTVTVTIVLAMATMGDMTQIGLFLFMLRCPRWPRQVSDCHVPLLLSPALSRNFCKWKHDLMPMKKILATQRSQVSGTLGYYRQLKYFHTFAITYLGFNLHLGKYLYIFAMDRSKAVS